ncbi:hypothetical protein FRC75_15245 [Paracidovorax citrulli]|nr:hypothetical protein CQB05_15340 [Paracidovorax citrulli]UMT84604.1 hypothetical protein FRC75_15245 [Paracidovorax citrulli]
MNRKRLVKWAPVAVSLLIVVGYSAIPRYDRSHYSPRHVYRLDYYEASWPEHVKVVVASIKQPEAAYSMRSPRHWRCRRAQG